LSWECEWKGEEKWNELRTEAAAARAGRRVFELRRRFRRDRAARKRDREGVQKSCILMFWLLAWRIELKVVALMT
jgi:hypothetical protein